MISSISVAVLATAGCTGIPKDGPTGREIRSGAAQSVKSDLELAYLVTDLDPAILRAANDVTRGYAPHFPNLGTRSGGPDVSIGVGDMVAVTIFESQSGGLFIPKEAASREGNFVRVPNQQVDKSGNIIVPYVDRPIRVAGRTAQSVSSEISKLLANRAIEPQVIVSIVEHRGNQISVLGEVNGATQFSLDPGGVNILNAIARSGGPKYPAYETTVTLQRNGVIHRAWLTSIVGDPKQNVSLRPNDVVYLAHEPRVFLALGATPSPGSVGGLNNRRFTFENERMTLSEAVAKAGGLDAGRADPKAVYIFRREPKDVLARAGLDVSRFGAGVPTVYKADLSKAGGFFAASGFLMRDKDIMFVAEDPSAELFRFLTILNGVTGNGANAAGAALSARTAIEGYGF